MKERILWADSLKGWLMVIVVLGHVAQWQYGVDGGSHLWAMIYSFHMPAFMAVSGRFAYRQNRTYGGQLHNIKRRSLQLLVPYLVWSAIKMVKEFDFSVKAITDVILQPDTSFWFLWVLFWINVIFLSAQWLADRLKKDELLTIGIAAIVLVLLMVGANVRLFGFQFLAYYFVFYVLGYCLHRFEWMRISNKMVLGLMSIVWLYLAWYWQMSHVPVNIASIPHLPAALAIQGYRFVTAILAIVVILSVAHKYLNNRNWLNLKAVEMGVISLGIYTVHLLFIDDVIALQKMLWNDIPSWLLQIGTFCLLTIGSFALVKLLNKYKITSKWLLGKV